MVGEAGIEPALPREMDFKSIESSNFSTRPKHDAEISAIFCRPPMKGD